MHKALWILMAALVAVGMPAIASAQEKQEEEPLVVRLSFFMCNLGGGNGDRIDEELETRVIPVWQALINEDRGVQDYGFIYHWWADEWNVGIYTIAESIQAILDAEEEADNRLEQQYGDEPTAFGQACPHHRDGFYTMGPSVGMRSTTDTTGGN